MTIPLYKIRCVLCGNVCFSHINSWWCDDCREKKFAKQDHPTEKGGEE